MLNPPPDGSFEIEVSGQHLILLPQFALFWKEQQQLILSDLHLGKTGHFRRHGIALPKEINQNNLDRLDQLITLMEPKSVLFLGDLFHSESNSEWDDFIRWREQYSLLPMYLTAGNHELYPMNVYQSMGLKTAEYFEQEPFLFCHHTKPGISEDQLTVVSGHIHPSILLKGKGRQRLRLPCYRVSEHEILMPAFGSFTGSHLIKPNAGDRIFVIAEDRIIEIKS